MEIDIWDNNNLTELFRYKQAAGTHVGMFSMQPEEMPGTNSWLPDGTPVIIPAKVCPSSGPGVCPWRFICTRCPSRSQELWYPDLNATDPYGDMEARIRALLVGKPTPFFVLVYGQLLNGGSNTTILDVAAEMQRRLAGGDAATPPVHTIGMQDMVDLAQQEGAYRRSHGMMGA